MATWSPVSAMASVGLYVDTDGTNLYYGRSGKTYKYDPEADTEEVIWNSFFTLCIWFKGDLYGARVESGRARVWRWNGALDDWTNVLDVVDGSIDIGGAWFTTDDTHLVLVANRGGSSTLIKYSADGTTWNDGDFSDNPGSSRDYDPNSTFSGGQTRGNSQTGIVGRFSNGEIYKWNNGTAEFDSVHTLSGGNTHICSNYDFHWRGIVASWTYERSTNFSSWNAASDDEIQPISKPQGQLSIGGKRTSNGPGYDVDFAYWDTDTGDWVDTGEQIASTSSGSGAVLASIMLDDGTLLALLSGWRKRSEPFTQDPAVGPVDTGNRVWVFKTENNGLTWTSRGVQT